MVAIYFMTIQPVWLINKSLYISWLLIYDYLFFAIQSVFPEEEGGQEVEMGEVVEVVVAEVVLDPITQTPSGPAPNGQEEIVRRQILNRANLDVESDIDCCLFINDMWYNQF